MPRRSRVYRRPVYDTILARAHEPRRFVQVLAGPRQVGKTTLARQVMDAVGVPAHFASADDPALREAGWLETQWEVGRARARAGGRAGGLLVLDEIQKVPGWADAVKRAWDADTAAGLPLRVMLLGSAPLLVQRGVTESLAGRFELVRVSHWTLAEMRDAFGWDLDRFLELGGYPGAAALADDRERWTAYLLDALVETTLARDVMLLTRVDKPALLRRLFALACDRSGEVLSYTRMLGELPGAGNTTTLAGYLELLAGAGMVSGLPKVGPDDAPRRRGSSPRVLALNTGLVTAVARPADRDPDRPARLLRTAVGAHLAGQLGPRDRLGYWREGAAEVDFVLVRDRRPPLAVAVEPASDAGLAALRRALPDAVPLVVGDRGVDPAELLASPLAEWGA